MQIFIATTLFLSGIVGSQSQEIHYNEVQVDANPWTGKPGVIRYTKTCEQDSGSPRGKRQAPEEPKQPNCYYHADDSITPPDCDGFCNVDSRRKCRDLNGTTPEYTCTRKPVFVPLGKVSNSELHLTFFYLIVKKTNTTIYGINNNILVRHL